MTIEDAILHAEEVAVRNEAEAARMMERKSIVKSLNLKTGGSDGDTDSFYDRLAEGALLCAKQERQYADWLRELVERRKRSEIVYCKDCRYKKDKHYEQPGEEPYIKSSCECKYGLTKDYTVHDWDFCSRAERRGAE